MKVEGDKSKLYFAEVNSNVYREWTYKEKAKYSVGNRNHFYNSMEEISIPENVGVHLSVYSYTKYIFENKSVAEYRDSTFANYVHVLFEKDKKNMRIVSEKVAGFLKEVEGNYKIPIEAWYIFYTGNSGYQLSILMNWFKAEPMQEFSEPYKRLVMQITKNYKDYINYNVCNKNSLISAPNSMNSKTKLYKIPLTYSELALGEPVIREMSKKQRVIEFPDVDVQVNKQLSEIFQLHKLNRKDVLL